MAMIKCPECGKEISDQSKECIHCGYSLLKNEMEKDISYKICPECRQRVSNNVNSCPNCGLPLCKPKRLKSNKSLFVAHWLNIIALILPIILVALSYLWEYFLPDNKSETNSGVTVSVDTNSVFNSWNLNFSHRIINIYFEIKKDKTYIINYLSGNSNRKFFFFDNVNGLANFNDMRNFICYFDTRNITNYSWCKICFWCKRLCGIR